MTVLFTVACAGMAAGLLILLRLSPSALADDIFGRLVFGRKSSIKEELAEFTGRKRKGWLAREVVEAQSALIMTGREHTFPLLCVLSLGLFAGGAAVAAMIGNLFLVPVLAIGMMILPFWYVGLTQSHFKKEIADELETALSIITTAYLRTEDIQTAVAENVEYLNPPVQAVFRDFLCRVRLVSADVTAALRDLRGKIDNTVFAEWCDALIACRTDRSLKSTLTPIVAKLSDMRVINGELENMVFEPRKEFVMMVVLVVGNIPLMRILNGAWYDALMHTTPGRLVLAICAATIFLCTAFVLKLTRPIEYRR